MKFLKKINNNVAFANDEDGTGYIVLGKGIGFSLKEADEIPDDVIDRRYILKDDESDNQDIEVLQNMASDVVAITSKVSELAKKRLDIEFDNAHYLILADHIDFAIKR